MAGKVEANLKLAVHIAKQYVKSNVTDSEQYSDALFGLFEASQAYNEDKQVSFGTYAFKVCKNAVIEGYRKREKHAIATVRLEELSSKEKDKLEYNVDLADTKEQILSILLAPHPEDTNLDRRNRCMLIDYFINKKTMQDIGDKHNISKMAVSLAVRSAICKIRSRHGDLIETLNEKF